MQRASAMQRAMRLATLGREYPWYGWLFRGATFFGIAVCSAAAVNRRHEHSATVAERFRSGRHRSDGETRAWPKVPSAVGDRAGYPRETGRRNRKRGERKEKRGEGGKIKDARERNHAGPASLLARLYRVSASHRWSSRRREERRTERLGEEGKMSPA